MSQSGGQAAGQNNALGTEPVGRLLVRYAVPSIVSMVVLALYNIVDQFFIARGVGFIGNGATTAAFPLVTVALGLALLVGNGSAAFISLELGRGNPDKARRALGNAMLLLVTFGIVLMAGILAAMTPLLRLLGATDAILPHAVDYLTYIAAGFPFAIVGTGLTSVIRADGSPRYSMLTNLAGALLNIVLDPIFIFAFGMGVKGAAVATTLSQMVACLIALYYVLRKGRFTRLTAASLRPDGSVMRAITALGSSNFLTQIAHTVVNIVLNNSLTHYGALTEFGAEIPLSAMGIVMKINTIFLNLIIGVSIGAQPIYGFNYGAKLYARVRKTYRTVISVTLGVAVAASLLFVFSPETFVGFFRDENELFNRFSATAMRVFLSCIFCAGIQIPSAGYFQAVGKPLLAGTLTMTRSIIILVPMILLLPLWFGLDGILYAGPVTDIAALCVTSVFIIREQRQLGKR